MSNNSEKIKHLLHRMDILTVQQNKMQKELWRLKNEVSQLEPDDLRSVDIEEEEYIPAIENKKRQPILQENFEANTSLEQEFQATEVSPVQEKSTIKRPSDWEKFIGENLINKIGILILILGVGVGAKYAIDKGMLSPTIRIMLGYLTGASLIGFAIKLKPRYEKFSAVLVSGAIAILYFVTFFAYNNFELIPQAMAFALMLLFTVFAVVAALNYDRQIIALFGLVGAYSTPFLLSSGSGNFVFLFSYMLIINIGILIISFKKYWKPVYYSSFVLTWVIFSGWFLFDGVRENFGIAWVFLGLFFALFYAMFLVYKLIKQEQFAMIDVIFLSWNSFIFFGLGYFALSEYGSYVESANQSIYPYQKFLGLFALINALIHFVVSNIIYRQKLADKRVFNLVAGMVLIFLTIAIPIQLDGNWVTIVWALEAALLFWIGRTQGVSFYEKMSYPLMLLACFSLLQDWSMVEPSFSTYRTDNLNALKPIFNSNFLTGILCIVAFGFIQYIAISKPLELTENDNKKSLSDLIKYVIPFILLALIFNVFRIEISHYWSNQFFATSIAPEVEGVRRLFNTSLKHFHNLSLVNYAMIFFTVLTFINIKFIKTKLSGQLNLIGNVGVLLMFLVGGLFSLSELKDVYLEQNQGTFSHGIFHIIVRYITLAIAASLLYWTHLLSKKAFLDWNVKRELEIGTYLFILWVLSSEIIQWLDFGGAKESYGFGLSILAGLYSLMLVWIGIAQKKKYLRLLAIGIFGITLLKLFFYDIANMSSGYKTLVLVALGVLLLIISFLYNRRIVVEEEKIEEKIEE